MRGRASVLRAGRRGLALLAVPCAIALGAIALGAALMARTTSGAASARGAKRIVLWAWERPEDLRFLGEVPPAGPPVSVAYLAETLELGGAEVERVPRRQPLHVPPGMELTAVVRVEQRRGEARLDARQRARIVEHFVALATEPGVRRVQIDFDAMKSQRAAYRVLLAELRAALPAGVELSMTALASWCLFDDWLSEAPLPVDAVVPMVFTMGPEGGAVYRLLEQEGGFRAPVCREHLGVAVGELWPEVREPVTLWVFNRRSWTRSRFDREVGER